MAKLVVASNRGPIQFALGDDGSVSSGRGAGGMIVALGSALAGEEGTWIAAAISEGDRLVAGRAADSGGLLQVALPQGVVRLRSTILDPPDYQAYYNRVANQTLWFLQHSLFDVPRQPAFDHGFREAWNSYREVNRTFAAACDEETDRDAEVFVQDYHLTLLPAMLREQRPDLAIAHYSHCPWAEPDYYAMLPGAVAGELLDGMLGADLLCFEVPRWARNFLRCCQACGYQTDVERATVRASDGRIVPARSYPLGVDGDDLRRQATSPEVQAQRRFIGDLAGHRSLVIRIDRMELSKNILRGLQAYEVLLERNPRLRERVVHLVLAHASRWELSEYRAYADEVRVAAEVINRRFGTEDWEPVRLEVRDNYPRALAAMALADVFVVNPLRDGQNMVAKEGPVVNERDAVLVLSRNAGAADDLADGALLVNPFDIAEMAEAIATAVSMPAGERARRAGALRAGALARPPHEWFASQRRDLAVAVRARRGR